MHYGKCISLGDVVLVLQGQAKIINEGSYEDVCIIRTPSKFSILLNEGRSRVLPYSCNNKVQINKLRVSNLIVSISKPAFMPFMHLKITGIM